MPPRSISSRFPRCSPALPISRKCSRRPARGAKAGSAHSSSSTRCTASTGPSRIPFSRWCEDGTVVLVGATTEIPSFELNAALLSRARVLVFRPLAAAAIDDLLAPRRGEIERARSRSTPGRARRAGAHGGRRWPRRAHACRGKLARRACGRNIRCREVAGHFAAARADLRDQSPGRPLQLRSSALLEMGRVAPIYVPRSIICAACSTPARARSFSPAGLCGWRSRT